MKRLALVVSLISSILVGIVHAGTLNVLVYPDNAEISSYIRAFLPKASLSMPLRLEKEKRIEASDLHSIGEKLDEAYKSENPQLIADARRQYDEYHHEIDEEPYDVVLLDSKTLDLDVDTIISNDQSYLRYICQHCDADVIIIPKVSKVGSFFHLSLYRYIYGEDGIRLVYERISAESDQFSASSMIRLSSDLIDGVPALIRLDGIADGAKITVDGEDATAVGEYIMTTQGKHIIALEAMGHHGRTILVEAVGNSVISLDASLPEIIYSSLMIETTPSSVVSVNGVVLGETPIMLDTYSLPLSLRFERDFYVGRNIGVSERSDRLYYELKPTWMSDESILKKKKDAFYWAFARSFLLFGAKVALGVFNDGSNNVLSSLDIAFNGVITVSIVDAIACLVDYYRQTEYISP